MKRLCSSLPHDGSPITQSPFLTGTKTPTQGGVDTTTSMMQPVSYSSFSLDITFILYHCSHARRTCCCPTRLASCLRLHFSRIFPHPSVFLPRLSYIVPCFISHIHMHAYVLPISYYAFSSVESVLPIGIGSGDNLSCSEDGELRPQCARWSCSLRNGNVR